MQSGAELGSSDDGGDRFAMDGVSGERETGEHPRKRVPDERSGETRHAVRHQCVKNDVDPVVACCIQT